MRKWFYLAAGVLLVINAVVVIFVGLSSGVSPVVVFQGLWGILGIFLLYKANKLFRAGMPSVPSKVEEGK